ncbi:hypothetical protein TIFTF001_029420 [Ficus carica]|uniref:Uncharacterized protein n=1 Tax=Ficus carica TaxID=3494 RepID=A0AA88J2E9_FICCA|nr:hypothetical protein TIFTF001_029420 [Ficus carica]
MQDSVICQYTVITTDTHQSHSTDSGLVVGTTIVAAIARYQRLVVRKVGDSVVRTVAFAGASGKSAEGTMETAIGLTYHSHTYVVPATFAGAWLGNSS